MTSPAGEASVDVTADASRFATQLQRELNKAAQRIRFDTSRIANQLRDAVKDALRDVNRTTDRVNIKADVDRDSLRRVASTISDVARNAATGAGRLGAVGAAGAVASAALAGAASAGAGLIPVIAQLASVLLTASGALVAVPGAIAIFQAALGTLRIGLLGVGDAFKAVAKDQAEFEQAIEDLAPAAQRFVRTIRDLKPAFDGLRIEVQQALFQGLAGTIRELAEVHLPGLRAGMTATASFMNQAVGAALERLTTEAAKLDLQSIFTDSAIAVQNLGVALAPLVDIVRNVAVVGSDVVAGLTGGIGETIGLFSQRIAEMRESGELRQLILDGIGALQMLGSVLTDVVGIFRGLFSAAGVASGGGIFGLLERLNELVNSVAGQEALANFFSELSQIGTALMPVLLALVQALGPVAAAIGDIAVAAAPVLVQLVESLGGALASLAPAFIALLPAVAAIAEGLAPLAQILVDLVVGAAPGVAALLSGLGGALSALAPVAGLVGEALGAMLQAVAPLLPVLGQIFARVLTEAATVLGVLFAALAPVIDVFAQMATTLLGQLVPVFTQLAEQVLPIAAQAGIQIAEAFAPLVPVLTQIGAEIVQAILPHLPTLLQVFADLVPVIAQLAQDVAADLLNVLISLAPHFPKLAEAGVLLALAIAKIAVAVVPLLPGLLQMALRLGRLIGQSPVLRTAINAVKIAFNLFMGAVRVVIGVVRTVIGLWNTARATASRLTSGVRDAVTGALDLFRGLPGRIKDAVGSLGSLLLQAGKDVISGLTSGISDALPSATSVASSIGSSILSAAKSALGIGSPSKLFADLVGKEIPAGIAMGIRSNAGMATGAIGDLVAQTRRFDRIAGSLGGVAPLSAAIGATQPAGTGAVGGGAGVRVWPTPPEQRIVLELDLRGDDEETIRRLRKSIRVRGGNVQLVLGGKR